MNCPNCNVLGFRVASGNVVVRCTCSAGAIFEQALRHMVLAERGRMALQAAEEIRAKAASAPPITDEEIDAKIKAARAERKKTPADRLADATQALLNMNDDPAIRTARAALDEYRATRNGEGATVAGVLGSPADPIKVARLLLDLLTGGALSSLLCAVRDAAGRVPSGPIKPRSAQWLDLGPHGIDNLRANLKALGEDI